MWNVLRLNQTEIEIDSSSRYLRNFQFLMNFSILLWNLCFFQFIYLYKPKSPEPRISWFTQPPTQPAILPRPVLMRQWLNLFPKHLDCMISDVYLILLIHNIIYINILRRIFVLLNSKSTLKHYFTTGQLDSFWEWYWSRNHKLCINHEFSKV